MSLNMATKRILDGSHSDPDQPTEKRPRTRPTLSSGIGEVRMIKSLKDFCSALEPMLRRVVNEEVESSIKRCSSCSFTRSPSLQIQTLEPSSLRLMFSKKLLLPIFTGSKIVDVDNASLQILLLDAGGDQMVMTCPPHPIKVEIVVLDGDFPADDRRVWTSQEFDNNIVKERTGKRPLLAGDCLTITLRDGFASIGDIEFTDNSSWIRSRRFRLGARVCPGSYQGVRIREAMTEAFIVKDHRGELYKKHHPPMLDDEVWRLEKIGKDGAFHKKLASEGINSVQDFLKLSIVDPQKLRRILGPGMSEKMWEATIKHARTCDMGNKHYIFRRPNCTVTLNPICQVVNAMIHGHAYTTKDLSSVSRGYIENLVKQAYANWSCLEEVIGVSTETVLLTEGEEVNQYPSHHQAIVKTFQQNGFSADHRYSEMGNLPTNANIGRNNWQITSTYHGATVEPNIRYSMLESSSDGESTPKSFINGN